LYVLHWDSRQGIQDILDPDIFPATLLSNTHLNPMLSSRCPSNGNENGFDQDNLLIVLQIVFLLRIKSLTLSFSGVILSNLSRQVRMIPVVPNYLLLMSVHCIDLRE